MGLRLVLNRLLTPPRLSVTSTARRAAPHLAPNLVKSQTPSSIIMARSSSSSSSSSASKRSQARREDLVGGEQGREPTSEEREPPVYEQGLNTGPDIARSVDVEALDVDLFRSKTLWVPARARGVFGGQVIGQAVAASNATVDTAFQLHSLHCYFLLAGDKSVPILYHVTRVRDGGSYVTRLVRAKQRGRDIFTIQLSYQKPEPAQPTFQIPLLSTSGSVDASESSNHSYLAKSMMQGLPKPEDSPLNEQRYIDILKRKGSKDLGGDGSLDEKIEKILRAWVKDRQSSSVEIRNALPGMYDEHGMPTPGYEQAFWMKTRTPVTGGDGDQKAALAFASDFYLLSTVPKSLGVSRNVQMMASLDHSMWFYEPFDVSKWMLFLMQSQAAAHGRGVTLGRVYQDGVLKAVVAQEGLVRAKLDQPSGSGSKL